MRQEATKSDIFAKSIDHSSIWA